MAVYKDHLFAARCRLSLLRAEHRGRHQLLPRELVRVFACRQARIWAGLAGGAGVLALVIDLVLGGKHASSMLIASWVLLGCSYLISRGLCGWRLVRSARRHVLDASPDPISELHRLEHRGPRQTTLMLTHRAEVLSLALPLAVLSLLTPLSLHLVFCLAFLHVDLMEFNRWIVGSCALVGHAHLTLLILAVLHVRRMRRELDLGLPTAGSSRGFKALLWATVAGAVPGVIMFCIPPALVFLTGVVFVPWMFSWAAHRIRSERSVLETHGFEYPAQLPWRAAID